MSLKDFYFDKHTRSEWNAFVMAALDEEALALVYAGKDTAAIKVARKVIEKSFRKLDTLYAPPRKPRSLGRGV